MRNVQLWFMIGIGSSSLDHDSYAARRRFSKGNASGKVGFFVLIVFDD